MALLNDPRWSGAVLSGGWRTVANTIPNIDPSTGLTIGQTGMADADDVARAVDDAVNAQAGWAAKSAEERARILRHAGDIIAEREEELADILMIEAGSAGGKAHFEAALVAGEFYAAAATAMMPYGQLLRSGKPRLSMARRRPVGVVGVISPFNFPAILSIRSVAPAIALGNAVILKPDPRTPLSGGFFLAQVFEDAGLPSGVLHVLPGGSDAGEALIDHPLVPVISFTGSTAVGRAIGERAGRNLKRAHLELGGNNALVILADADVDAAASAGAWGSFLHQGQICMTTGRHFVHASIHDEYVDRLAQRAAALSAGDPRSGAPLGPLIDDVQRDRVHRLVSETIAAGGKLIVGGTYDGRFYAPSVLTELDASSPAFAEEIFGPVAAVVAFENTDQLVELVNASPYGLSLGILSSDAFAAFELSERIPAGIVHINDQTVDDEPAAPFGGVGASGTGSRFGGHEANIEAFTETQWITIQGEIARYPW
ncbi:MAG: aldehyde dehydrogenase family protein [Pseudolysinimonas sp.]